MFKKIAVVLTAAALLAGCSGSDDVQASDVIGTVTKQTISPERCEANKQAGQIVFLTGFDFAASAGIIDAVVADQLGYFKKMCLDVKLQPGFDTSNIPLLSGGQATFGALGSFSEIADAAAKGGNIQTIAVYGHKAIEELAVSAKSTIQRPQDVKGTTMGVLGTVPFSIRVMLARAGVPLDSFKQVEAGFNPVLLDQGTFQSRPVYKSSEPRQLRQANVQFREIDPSAHGVRASFAALVVNKNFARQHPTATEDFLRADLQGFHYALANPNQAVSMAYAKTDPKYYLTQEGENARWLVEAQLVKESTPAGKPYGYLDEQELKDEITPLVEDVKSLAVMPDVRTLYDDRFIKRVHDGTTVIWPEQ